MTEPEDEVGVQPIYVRTTPCKNSVKFFHQDNPAVPENPYVDNDGRCADCGQKVPHDRLEPDRPNRRTRVAHDHDRPVRAYVFEDVRSCSCGGWAGTPIGADRVDNGAELLLLSFQGRVDDIERNQANLVDQVLLMNEKLDRLLGE